MNPKPAKIIPALYGGIIMGLISSIPFLAIVNCLCCAGILSGGFLAVLFYKKNFTPETPPFTAGDCLALGALAGVFGAVVDTILSLVFIAIFGNIAQEFLLNFVRNLNIPQEALDIIEEAVNQATSGAAIFLNFITTLISYSLFGMLGGLIGYGIYKPKQQTMPPPPMPQPL